MRRMLANILLQDADVMILDEPAKFLDLLGIMWLQTYLFGLRSSSPKTLVILSHNRAFIDHVCEKVKRSSCLRIKPSSVLMETSPSTRRT